MIRKTLAVAFAAVLVLLAIPGQAHADTQNVSRSDVTSGADILGGNAYGSAFATMDRDRNGTFNNDNDDRIDFGRASVDVDLIVEAQYEGLVICELWGLQDNLMPYDDDICFHYFDADNKIASVEVTIQKLKVAGNPSQGYEQHWQDVFSSGRSFYLPSTNIDWNKKPRLRVEIRYGSWCENKTVTKHAWVAAWENL